MGMTGSIFQPRPPNFKKNDTFYGSTNDVTIKFGNFHFCKSWKKCTQARRPGVEESLASVKALIFVCLELNGQEHGCIVSVCHAN